MELHSLFSVDNSKAILPLVALVVKGLGLGAKKHSLGKAVKEGTKEVVKDKAKQEIQKKEDNKKTD